MRKFTQKYWADPEWTPKIMKNSAIDSFFNSASDPEVGGNSDGLLCLFRSLKLFQHRMISGSPLPQIHQILSPFNLGFSLLYKYLMFFWCRCVVLAVRGVLMLRVQKYQEIETVVTLSHNDFGWQTQGRTGYLSTRHMSKHMLIGGINTLPYSSHMPTVHIWNLIQVSSKMQIYRIPSHRKNMPIKMGWLICSCYISTVKTLITHTFWWTVQAMGFQGLWVGGGGKKISAQESWQKFLRKSYFLCYNGSAGPQGKHSMPFGQVIVDALLLNGVGFIIEQRLIWITGWFQSIWWLIGQ